MNAKALVKSPTFNVAVGITGAFMLGNALFAYDTAMKSDEEIKGFTQLLFGSQIFIGAYLIWKNLLPNGLKKTVMSLGKKVVNEKTIFFIGAALLITNGGFQIDASMKSDSDVKYVALATAIAQILGGVVVAAYGVYLIK